MSLKKYVAMALGLCMMGSVVGCSGGDASADVDAVLKAGKLVVGITEFAPMDYRDSQTGEWIGFDADMARLFAEDLGVDVEFVEINWNNKLLELETRAIDVVWNGMTMTEEVMAGSSTSEPYCYNGQVIVMKESEVSKYTTVESLKSLNLVGELGSAGAGKLEEAGLKYLAVDTQAKALMEVASGASDACVLDLLMAGAMVGEGTSYPSLTYEFHLSEGTVGAAFRKGSDLTDTFNEFWKEAYDAGTVASVASVYGLQGALVAK